MSALLDRWDRQQAAYIAAREDRFEAILDVLGLVFGAPPAIVDLACGPGSLTVRLLERFPQARVLGIDRDPLLLRMAEDAVAPFGGRAALLDADLAADGWPAQARAALGGAQPVAMTSTTALHWLPPDALLRAYAQAHDALAPGGVLLNGDHFRFDARHPTLRQVAERHDTATQEEAFAAGAETWDAWWSAARDGLPDGAALDAERARRFAGRGPTPSTTVGFHLAALAQAGFVEAAPVWQLLDDYVVFGRKAGAGR